MALSDKNIVITPNIGQADDPKIVFSGADASTGAQNITLRTYVTNNGTLSFEGSAGQLFSITNSLTGTIFSVNDISGIPSIEVLDTGLVKLAQYSGNVVIGSATDNGSKLQVTGDIASTTVTTSGNVIVGGNLTVNGTTITATSTTLTIVDPIITLGGETPPTTDDHKDRGVEFRWHNGTVAKVGFFGFDNSSGKFTFIPDATNTSEVFSGTAGTIVATTFEGNLTGNVTGTVSGNAGSATQVYITNTNTAGTYYVPYVGSSASGNQGLNVYTSLSFNPNTGVLTTTTFSGALSGNATTATTLATARSIWGQSFNGSAAVTGSLSSVGPSITFTKDANNDVSVAATATDVAGKYLTLSAGSTIAGTNNNDVNGGQLILQAGAGAGSGTSIISFVTGTPTTAKTLQTLSTKMTILGNGNVGIGITNPLSKTHIHLESGQTVPLSAAVMSTGGVIISGLDGNLDLLSRDDNSYVANNLAFGRYKNSDGAIISKFGITVWADTGSQNSNLMNRFAINYGTSTDIWNNTELFTIKRSGNVGIGSTSPSYKLEIADRSVNNTAFQNHLALWSNNYNESSNGTFDETKASHGIGFYRDWNTAGSKNLAAGIYHWGSSNWAGGLAFRTASAVVNGPGTMATHMIITDGGRIGIGTLSPAYKLHIYAAAAQASTLIGSGSTGDAVLILDAANGDGSGSDYMTVQHTRTGNSFQIKYGGTALLTTLSTGEVGIKEVSPSELLHLNGNFRIDDTAGNAGFKMSYNNTSKTLDFAWVGA